MAIRRISDLPSLNGTYDDADFEKCIVETSYKAPNKLKYSLNMSLEDIVRRIEEKAA